MTGTWRVDAITRADGSRPSFPYVLTLTSQGKQIAYRTRELWPPPTGNVYMERYRPVEGRDTLSLVEEFPLLSLKAVHGKRRPNGKQVSTIHLAIDRPSRKHCSILQTREYAGDDVAKEAVFLRTEAATKSHRSRFYLQPRSQHVAQEIVIDSREKHPWTFAAERVTRGHLRSGDYALRIGEKTIAVIERKTFENALSMLSTLESYHTHLTELATYAHGALVIEANYADFLNPKKVVNQSAPRCAEALADLHARHPGLQVQFAGNRKGANVWAAHFFAGCAALATGTHAFDAPEQTALVDDRGRANTGGIDAEIRHAVMQTLPTPIRLRELVAAFPTVAKKRLGDCLKTLRSEGKLTTSGHGAGTCWHRNR